MCNWFLNRKIMLQWKFTNRITNTIQNPPFKRSKNNPEEDQVLTLAIIIWIWNIVLMVSILRNITFVLEYPEKKLRFPLLGSEIFKEKWASPSKSSRSPKCRFFSDIQKGTIEQGSKPWGLTWTIESWLLYGCFRKWWYPQIIHFNRVFHYKPSILGYPYFWKHPYRDAYIGLIIISQRTG